MLKHRVIPALLLQNGGLVKTKNFKSPQYVGDPINAIRIFNEKEVDELILIDIKATQSGRGPDYETIKQVAGECFMPLCYGGGISTVEQAARIFSLGVEKICIQSNAFTNLQLISQISERFGSQSIVSSIDIKKDWLGRHKLYRSDKRKNSRKPWLSHINETIAAGAGEILLNAVDRDGTLKGPDLELISSANQALEVPLIALGGIGSLQDIKNAVQAGANAVAAGAFFVYSGPHRAVLITYPKYQELEQLFAKP